MGQLDANALILDTGTTELGDGQSVDRKVCVDLVERDPHIDWS
ncbi:hypothetical protein [Aromatoleum aromaticum]|nr:hypothetical protein [Aromatoleum aromaticum]